MKQLWLSVAMLAALGGCTTSGGADWMTADFNKKNGQSYREFDTSGIQIGMSKEALISLLPGTPKVVEAGAGYEVLAFDRWASVAGPDYVDQRLYARLNNGSLENWKIVSESIEIVPRSW